MYQSIDEFKQNAEFFKKESIIPVRIFKCSVRKQRAHVKFGADTWVVRTPGGYVGFALSDPDNSALKFTKLPKSKKDWSMKGSPYHQNGTTALFGNLNGEDSALEAINLELATHCLNDQGIETPKVKNSLVFTLQD
jgi:hypothetical protein